MADDEFDPELYLIAEHATTGGYDGLVRVWNRMPLPRLGSLAVRALALDSPSCCVDVCGRDGPGAAGGDAGHYRNRCPHRWFACNGSQATEIGGGDDGVGTFGVRMTNLLRRQSGHLPRGNGQGRRRSRQGLRSAWLHQGDFRFDGFYGSMLWSGAGGRSWISGR